MKVLSLLSSLCLGLVALPEVHGGKYKTHVSGEQYALEGDPRKVCVQISNEGERDGVKTTLALSRLGERYQKIVLSSEALQSNNAAVSNKIGSLSAARRAWSLSDLEKFEGRGLDDHSDDDDMLSGSQDLKIPGRYGRLCGASHFCFSAVYSIFIVGFLTWLWCSQK